LERDLAVVLDEEFQGQQAAGASFCEIFQALEFGFVAHLVSHYSARRIARSFFWNHTVASFTASFGP